MSENTAPVGETPDKKKEDGKSINKKTLINLVITHFADPFARHLLSAWVASLPADHLVLKGNTQLLRDIASIIEGEGDRLGILGQATTEKASDWLEMLADFVDARKTGQLSVSPTVHGTIFSAQESVAHDPRMKFFEEMLKRASNPKVRDVKADAAGVAELWESFQPVFEYFDKKEGERAKAAKEAAEKMEAEAKKRHRKGRSPFAKADKFFGELADTLATLSGSDKEAKPDEPKKNRLKRAWQQARIYFSRKEKQGALDRAIGELERMRDAKNKPKKTKTRTPKAATTPQEATS